MPVYQSFQQKHPISSGHGANEEWAANVVPIRVPFDAPDAAAAIAKAARWTEFLNGKKLARLPIVEELREAA